MTARLRLPKISWVKEDSGMLSRHNDIKHTVEEWAGMESAPETCAKQQVLRSWIHLKKGSIFTIPLFKAPSVQNTERLEYVNDRPEEKYISGIFHDLG